MSLNGALQVGQSAILASQAAISVAGNNMANAATPGYHRQRISIMPGRPEAIGRGQFVGTGVQIGAITRHYTSATLAADLEKLEHRPELLITHNKPGFEAKIQAELPGLLKGWAVRFLQRGDIISI